MSIVYRSTSLPGLEALSCRSDFPFIAHLHSSHVLRLHTGCGEHFRIKETSAIRPANFDSATTLSQVRTE
jgi:hypothetical protein